MLETPVYPRVLTQVSDNPRGAGNQQERPVEMTGILRDYTPSRENGTRMI